MSARASGLPRDGTRRSRPPIALLLALLALSGLATVPASEGAAPSGRPECAYAVQLSGDPTAGEAPLLVHLNATVTGGAPAEFDWQFGDGSFWNATGPGATTPIHRYSSPGTYTVVLTATGPGCTGRGQLVVAATAAPLLASISAVAVLGAAPDTVRFDLTVGGGSGTYPSALWNFGDGGVGSGFPIEYTYAHAGTYSASVNVTDSAGHWVVASARVVVPSAPGRPMTGLVGSLTSPAGLGGIAVGAAVAAGALVYLLGRGLLGSRRPGGPKEPSVSDAARSAAPLLGSNASLPGPIPRADPAAGVPGTRARTRERPPPSAERLYLTQRVILHIGAQGVVPIDGVAPPTLTQAGMAGALGVGQNSLTNVLRRLVAAGILDQDVRHVVGRPRRLRVYRFTARGESVYRDLWTRASAPPTRAR